SFAGVVDCSVPHVRELQSILTYQNVLPLVSTAFNNNCSAGCSPTTCSCTFDGDYWSSTSSVSGPSNAWFAGFHYANVNSFGRTRSEDRRAGKGGAAPCTPPATGETRHCDR